MSSRPGQVLNVLIPTHSDELAVLDGDGPGARESRVNGDDVGVDYQLVGGEEWRRHEYSYAS